MRSWQWGSGARGAVVALVAMAAAAPAAPAQILYEGSIPSCTAQGCVQTHGLWAMNDDGSNPHLWLSETAVPLAGAGLSAPSISPDGTTVVFAGSTPDGAIWSTGIYRWTSGQVTRLSPPPRAGGTETLSVQTLEAADPEVGPDGWVYYARRWHVLGSILTGDHGQIWRQSLSDVGGEGQNTGVCQNLDIGFGAPGDLNIGAPSPNPRWPGMFAYTGCYQVTGPLQDTTLLRVVDPQSGEFTAIADSDGYTLSDPSWSSDGSEIVFVRDHGTAGGPHELRVATWDGAGWSQRLLYSGVNQLASPRFASDRIVFTESNRFPDGDPCTDCGIGIRSIPITCSACTEPASTILAQAHNSDLLDPAWTGAALPRTALPTTVTDTAGVLRGQTLRGALAEGLKLIVVCSRRCSATATASIDGALARRLALLTRRSRARTYQVGSGSLRAGSGRRTLTLHFTARSQRALRRSKSVKLTLVVRCRSGRLTTYRGVTTLRR